mgnify:CR=1 FL=1
MAAVELRNVVKSYDGKTNVIHGIGEEFTGPLHFVQFWLDTIAEWQRETGKRPLIALSCTKDVQDAGFQDVDQFNAVRLLDGAIPRPTAGRMRRWLTMAVDRCLEYGITEVHDMNVATEVLDVSAAAATAAADSVSTSPSIRSMSPSIAATGTPFR